MSKAKFRVVKSYNKTPSGGGIGTDGLDDTCLIINEDTSNGKDNGIYLGTFDKCIANYTPAAVATSGSYNDLTDKPTIPTNTSQLTNNNQTFIGRTDDIISNTDADNFTDSGAYLFQTGNGENNTNFPITGYGILNVFNSPYSNRTTNYIGQLLLGTYSIFYRTKVDTWSDWKRIALTSDIPTKLSQLTDDVVAGKYLRATIYGNFDADTLFNDGFRSGYMSHIPSGSPYGMVHTLSYRGGSNNTKPDFASQIFIPSGDDNTSPNDMFFRTSLADSWNGWNKVITDKNIGNYEAGSSVWSKGLDRITSIPASGHCVYFYSGQPTLGDDINNAKEGSNAYHLWSYPAHGTDVAGGTANIMNLRLQFNTAYLHDIFVSPNFDDVWHRSIINYKCNPWRKFAFTDSNVASATKLQTPRSIWGQSFDGTGNVSGNLYSDIWRVIKDSTWNGTFIQSANYDGTSDIGNIYMSARNGNKLTSFNVWANNSKFSNNVTVAGNVGIGTTSPSEKLDVAGNIKASGDITANKFIGSIRGNIIYDNGTDEGHFIGLGSNGVGVKGLLNYVYGNFPILFYINGFERMRIGEYVGIGTTSPTEKLDVAGNVKASAFIKTGSSDSYVLLGGGGHKSLSDFSKASWKTFTPAETALTNDDVLSTTGEFSLAKGTWSYASNGYLSAGEFGNIDLAGCSVLTFGGKSGGVYTQLFITAPATSTPSSKANEILFYNNHGSEYNPGWTRVLTNRNYTEYITDTNYYHTRSYSSGLQISTGTGVSNMYVPYATASQAGVISTGSQTFAGAKTFNSKVTASAFYQDSDERLKTFGDDIKVDFDELAKLRKSHFVFNNNPTKQEIGVSAQEVQKIYPEIVNETEEGTLSVDYSKLAVVALAAIDKLNQRVQELENKLAKYE